MDRELVNKVIDLCLIHGIKESELYLKFLDNQIKIYQNHINYLETTKPWFFQKEKLKQHNKEIEQYENKIYETYRKMNDEVDHIIELRSSIGEG